MSRAVFRNGQLNKNDLSLKSFGHFSQPRAVDTVFAVVNRLTFFVFEKRGDATPFSFEKPVVGHEETDEDVHSSIDFLFLSFQ